MEKYISKCESDTTNFGMTLAENLKCGDVVAISGTIGAGKTALTKGIAKYFAIDDTHSPTYTIVNEYYGNQTLYHFDAYRITADDWQNNGFDEYLFGDGICVIEWAENISDILPPNTVYISINKMNGSDESFREIIIGKEF